MHHLSFSQSSQAECRQQKEAKPKNLRGAQSPKETWTQTRLEEQVQTQRVRLKSCNFLQQLCIFKNPYFYLVSLE